MLDGSRSPEVKTGGDQPPILPGAELIFQLYRHVRLSARSGAGTSQRRRAFGLDEIVASSPADGRRSANAHGASWKQECTRARGKSPIYEELGRVGFRDRVSSGYDGTRVSRACQGRRRRRYRWVQR